MFSQINISQIVDLGFIALVSFVCIRNIFSPSGDDAAKRAEGVRADLRELESALRDLIGEAAAASGNLDRSLNRRKAELEALLRKIESKQAANDDPAEIPAAPVRPHAAAARTYQAKAVEAGFPNDSWVFDDQTEESAEEIAGSLRELIENSDDSVTLSHEFERIAEKREAEVRGRNTANRQAPTAKQKPEAKQISKGGLGAALAKRLAETKAEEQEYIPDFIEPGTFRVAKRLLMAGQEIHVVSRKLDMPLGDVRVIERLIRGGWEDSSGEAIAAAAVEGIK